MLQDFDANKVKPKVINKVKKHLVPDLTVENLGK